MTQAPDLPAWAALLTAALLLLGSGTTLVGSLGLLRLKTFYERVHAPTLGTTLGTALIVRGLRVVTSKRKLSFGSFPTGAKFSYEAPTGFEIITFKGTSGVFVDSIGVNYRKLGG